MTPEFYSKQTRVTLQQGGRIVIPIEIRRLLGLSEGDEIILNMNSDETLSLSPLKAKLKSVRTLLAKYNFSGNLSEEIIADRRREAVLET